MITSFPKLNSPVFDDDACAWPNCYGLFKALVDDQQLSKAQKMIYLKASVKGTAGIFLMVQFALVTRRPYCPGGPKTLCLTTLSFIPMVSIARLSVVKQSSFGLPGQYGRRVTRVNVWQSFCRINPTI